MNTKHPKMLTALCAMIMMAGMADNVAQAAESKDEAAKELTTDCGFSLPGQIVLKPL